MRGQQARGKVYARRLKGDIDLGLEPRRPDIDRNLRWAEMLTPGGLLPGGIEQDIYGLSTLQNYRIGTRRMMDERVFRYTQVGDISKTGLAGANSGFRHGIMIISENYLHKIDYDAGNIITCNKGEEQVTLDMEGRADVWGDSPTVALNEYQGGYFSSNDTSAGCTWGCKILSNTKEDEDTHYVTFSLETPLPFTAAAGDWANVSQNPWWRINYPADGVKRPGPWSPYVGVLQHYNPKKVEESLILKDMYIWVQTWGPMTGPIMGRAYGVEECERMLYCHSDGTFTQGAQATGPAGVFAVRQIAGWFMNNNYNAAAPYDMPDDHRVPVVFLMIAP